MKTTLLSALTLLASLTVHAETADESRLIALTDAFDAAVGEKSPELMKSLVLDGYTYVEPDHRYQPPSAPPLSPGSLDDRINRRRDREWCCRAGVPAIVVVDGTAVVTGIYRVVDRDITGRNTPRMLAMGRYTTTWVRKDGDWRLLAEHRSLDDEQVWASAGAEPNQPRVPAGAASDPDKPAQPADGLTGWLARRRQDRQDRAAAIAHRGFVPNTFTNLFRSYEPTRIGYTFDQGDEAFMDFTFSTMLPLHPAAREYPPPFRRRTNEDFGREAGGFWPWKDHSGLNVYFAATVRSGQYIFTRPSSPVVGKRFNPLLAFRFWETDRQGRLQSEDNFFELVYAHESNGQFISSRERFDQQLQTYLDQAHDSRTPEEATIASNSAYHSARDNISRGWDYFGFQFARDWDLPGPDHAPKNSLGLRLKYTYYLNWGIAQHHKEEYNSWEDDAVSKPRNRFDGLSTRWTLKLPKSNHPDDLTFRQTLIQFPGPHSLLWTTGSFEPFKYNTFSLEAGMRLLNTFPLTFWYRYGYNSDLVDYYRKDHSLGVALSYWNF